MTPTRPPRPDDYDAALAGEAAFWGEVARGEAALTPPDWDVRREWLVNRADRARDVDALLASIVTGTRVLELGCGAGTLTIGLARRGAEVTAVDVSPEALSVAQRYYASIATTLPGRIRYERLDLNDGTLPPGPFQLVAAMGVLHHLVDAQTVVAAIANALEPGGRFWAIDVLGRDSLAAATIAGALLLVLPSEMPFIEKWRGLLRFGAGAPARVRASIEAEGLSPMEGAGRGIDWIEAISERFELDTVRPHPALSGYLASQLRLPRRLAGPLVAAVAAVDRTLVRAGAWRGAGVTIDARKRAVADGR